MARFFRHLMVRLLCLYAAMDDLLMATPPRQKSSQVESIIESGKFLKLSSQVLDIRGHLNLTFGVEYFE